MTTDNCYCEKCHRTMRSDEFYSSNNLEKYPDGKLKLCKKCISMHVDNWNPETFLWILQEADVPYVSKEWNSLLASYGKDRSKVTGMTILGRYLSKMRIKQYSKYRWADTEFLQELEDHKIEEAMTRRGYSAAEITQALQETEKIVIPDGGFQQPDYTELERAQLTAEAANQPSSQPDYFAQQNGVAEIDLGLELQEDEKKMLCLKWGKSYKPEEWVRLEQLYLEMTESYDIQGAGHEDILKLVCKTSLKANQLLDIGDVDGAQKMIKMYDGLMKSGKFTAVQNKAEKGEYLDSLSELVMLCEKEGFIPRYYTGEPKDRVDETLQDLKEYTRQLVVEEMNLGNLIDNAVKQMSIQENRIEDEDIDIEDDDISLDDVDALKEDDSIELSDEDYADFYQLADEQTKLDAVNIKLMMDGEV